MTDQAAPVLTAPTDPESSNGLRAAFARLAIGAKLGLVMALGFAMTGAVCFSLIARTASEANRQHQTTVDALTADLLASQVREALATGRPVGSQPAGAITHAPGLVMVEAVAADGSSLINHRSQTAGPVHEALAEEAIGAARLSRSAETRIEGSHRVEARPVLAADGQTLLAVVALGRDNELSTASFLQQAQYAIAISLLIALAGLVAVAGTVAYMVNRPLSAVRKAMTELAAGNYAVWIPGRRRQDEIGAMASCMADLRDTLAARQLEREARDAEAAERQKLFRRLAAHLRQLAEGEIDCPIDVTDFSRLDDDHLGVSRSFNEVQSNLRDVLASVVSTAQNVRNSAREISEVAVDQSHRSEAQAATLEESAAAIEELNASVQQTAEHASEADKRIAQNKKQAQAGGEVVGKTVDAMKSIEESSQQITAIIGVIDDIAFQTNLLALNAGVEAARAGDAGRGFAVVASEVRALAQRASDSANEIKELILRSSEEVTRGSSLASKAGSALSEIIEGVNHVSDLVSHIAAGSRAQANNLAEIKDSVSNLDRVTQQNAAVIEESSAASRSLSDEAERMTEVLASFHLGDSMPDDAGTEPPEYASWSAEIERTRPVAPSAYEHASPRPAELLRHASGGDAGWDEF